MSHIQEVMVCPKCEFYNRRHALVCGGCGKLTGLAQHRREVLTHNLIAHNNGVRVGQGRRAIWDHTSLQGSPMVYYPIGMGGVYTNRDGTQNIIEIIACNFDRVKFAHLPSKAVDWLPINEAREQLWMPGVMQPFLHDGVWLDLNYLSVGIHRRN